MSAKCITFAPEIVDNMKITEITHTRYRCRHSHFETDGTIFCKAVRKSPFEADCARCKYWRASEIAEEFFAGRITGTLNETLANIYLARRKQGRL